MTLSGAVTYHLLRLGASLTAVRAADAVAALVREVVWPGGKFANLPGVDWPLVRGLRFLPPESRGRFWDGWERDFAAVDPARLFPLAFDDNYYYFMAANDGNPGDPLVYCVDHEESGEEPYGGRFGSVSELLSVLAAEGPAE